MDRAISAVTAPRMFSVLSCCWSSWSRPNDTTKPPPNVTLPRNSLGPADAPGTRAVWRKPGTASAAPARQPPVELPSRARPAGQQQHQQQAHGAEQQAGRQTEPLALALALGQPSR